MTIKDVLAGLGGVMLFVMVLLVSVGILAIFYFGSVWASSKLLPWFSIFTFIAFWLVVLVFLPLSIPRATRSFASVALFISSYVFGATLWMFGLLLTLSIWGLTAVIIGIFLGGIGVIPIAMVAAFVKGMWRPLFDIVILTVITFGSRIGAMSLSESLDE